MTARSLLLLAGGENSRMEALRGTIYKAFLPVNGLSLVARHVLRAQLAGIEQIDVVVDEEDPLLRTSLGGELASISVDHPALKVDIHVHAGSTGDKVTWFASGSKAEQPLLVALGDSLARVDLQALAGACEEAHDSAIAVTRLTLPFGSVECEGGGVVSFTEKPTLGLMINTGYMALGPKALDKLRRQPSVADVLADLAAQGALGAIECSGLVVVDTLASLAAVGAALAETGSEHFEGDVIQPP